MYHEILCTVGPSSLNDYTLVRFEELGVKLLRINLSHTLETDLAGIIRYIQEKTKVPICLDTEGAQIRTGSFPKGELLLEENKTVHLFRQTTGDRDPEGLWLYPEKSFDLIEVGDMISIDFNAAIVQVVEKTDRRARLRVLIGGMVRKNKAVTIMNREVLLPAVTDKDIVALSIGREWNIRHAALSFANRLADVLEIKKHLLPETALISKIESIEGLKNLSEIAAASDAILIDRGDLSRQVGIERIPWIQKTIIRQAKARGAKVYVATNLLESMVTAPYPTRAETNDIFNTLADGADGLVLAAEAAIGNYPIHCVSMVSKMMEQFSEFRAQKGELDLSCVGQGRSFLLVEPHGGELVDRFRPEPEEARPDKRRILEVDYTDLLNVEQIALGTFSPLQGFMNREALESVLETYRLPNGDIWPLPVVLQVPELALKEFFRGETIQLADKQTGIVHGRLRLEERYTYDLETLCLKMFGTADTRHPGVRVMKARGNCFLAGPVELSRRLPSPHKYYELTPREVRTLFAEKGWSKVVGFHTHNVAHRAHEHIQKIALETHHCDGLFIHPIVGPKKSGDYHAGIILKSYELMLKSGCYPKDKVLLAAFQNYSRYCGPREAVFTALCRKNFGCSHFIVGRDHTGVEGFYGADEARKFFERLGDIGIEPLFFNEQHYCRQCQGYVEACMHGPDSILKISGTEGRAMLIKKTKPPEWFMRKEISELILNTFEAGEEVFLA